ncbi:Eco57I restriction-modification methylase domain-containing protein, partial [Tenacibaculum dicentrarchi]|uniref:Eco57I restriction-modification methylase domain-containing protein n=1 Tax=Tenacibaculum dicentrarchi TaxID=669041 RepID=UPI003518E063
VFYTPKYITKYIVDNTVGKLCTEKKIELGIKEDDYFKGRKNRPKTTIIKLVSFLDVYREWLLKLTICDPACGSGAFLNQALDFLIKEHTYIDELKTKLLGGGFVFPDIENKILENNIFGVDLNEESVEIAKLSLWLRTAQPRRKLNNLNSNIKCGNSLIDSKTVAGDKAFKWENEFPQIFENGGFDVVIGNPPYVQTQLDINTKNYLLNNYKTIEGKPDLYRIFMEKSIKLLGSNSRFSFITPNSFLTIPSSKKLRNYFKENVKFSEIINFEGQVFNSVGINAVIFVCKNYGEVENIRIINDDNTFPNANSLLESGIKAKILKYNNYLKLDSLILGNDEGIDNLVKKILKASLKLNEIADYTIGMQVYHNTMHSKEDIKERVYHSTEKIDETYLPEISGKILNRYSIDLDFDEYVSYGEWCYNKPSERFISGERILVREIPGVNSLKSSILRREGVPSKAVIIVKSKTNENYELLSILNSKLIGFYVNSTTEKGKQKLFPRISLTTLKKLPIKKYPNDILSKRSKYISELFLDFNKFKSNFQNYLKQTFQLEKLSKKLQNWHDLEFGDFIKELNKAIKSNNKELVKNE